MDSEEITILITIRKSGEVHSFDGKVPELVGFDFGYICVEIKGSGLPELVHYFEDKGQPFGGEVDKLLGKFKTERELKKRADLGVWKYPIYEDFISYRESLEEDTFVEWISKDSHFIMYVKHMNQQNIWKDVVQYRTYNLKE